MCGIVGAFWADRERPVERPLLAAMDAYVAARGPDGAGTWLGPGVGFAHRRLSILDLDERASQPMVDPLSGCVVTYNGEIYNFRELRGLIEGLGGVFRTTSDTEVLLQGYRVWGLEALLDHLDGMYAFALFDPRDDSLSLCRDRFGKKPLYYLDSAGGVLFASDIRAIWAVTPDLHLDMESLDYYLTELSVPQPRTIWREIRQVGPAEAIVWSRGRSRRSVGYWCRTFEPKRETPLGQTLEEIDACLRAAVVKRTVSDVPVGAFLSGGLDSGLVVAHLATSSPEPVPTFSVSVDDPEMDEGPLARLTARRYGTRHTELRVDVQPEAALRGIVEILGEPFADSSILPSFLVAREMRQHVKVVLSGDGGDELFGYPEYGLAHRAEVHEARHPTRLSRLAVRTIDKLKRLLGAQGEYAGLLQHYAASSGARRLFRTMGFSWEDKASLYADPAAAPSFARDWLERAWAKSRQLSLVDTLVEAGFRTRLLNDYLVKVDRASMAHGLEVRSPFLDRALAERSFLVPNDQKFAEGRGKYVLRRLASKYLEPEVAAGPKRGFGVPMGRWLEAQLAGLMSEVLHPERLRREGLFDWRQVECLRREHGRGGTDHSHRLFSLLAFGLWRDRFAKAV